VKRLWERLRHPVLELTWHLAAENRCLRAELDAWKAEAAVAKCREKRWRRAARIACEGNPAALRLLEFQQMSDDIADADEIEPHQRNTPRAAP
jgi:hypothetical protein